MPKDINNVGATNANKLFDIPLHLQPGQVNTLSFSQDSIASMRMAQGGELEITFRDGSKLVVENFNELADSAKSCGRDTLIQLSDNTIIYPDELRDQLAQAPVTFTNGEQSIIAVGEPKPGQMISVNVESGKEYKLGFGLDGVNAAESGQNLILTFKNGGIVALNNFYTATNSDLPPVMTLANGSAVDVNALLASCKLIEIPTAAELAAADAPPQTELRQAAPDIEPAAGGDTAHAAAKMSKGAEKAVTNVADIEPAAGDAAGPINATGGAGFGSSIDPANFAGNNPIGPIGATALNYRAPEIPTIPYVSGIPSTTVIDDKPILGVADNVVDETNFGTVSGVITADFGHDGPGAFAFNTGFATGGSLAGGALTSHGVPVVVTLTPSGYVGTAGGDIVFTLTIDPVTGAYTYNQIKPFDHADTTNPDDVISLTFGVTATDADGDTGTTKIIVNVHDDGPVAVNDGNTVLGPNNLTAIGNVTANDNYGEDGPGHVTAITFNGTTVAVPSVGTATIVGQFGTLVISADGAYTYKSANAALGTDSFTYTIVDFDGDPSSAILSVSVEDLDTIPVIVNGTAILDETGVAPDGTESVSGSVSVNYFGDGPGSVAGTGVFTSGGSQKGGALTSNGVAVVVTLAGDTYTGKANGVTVFTLKVNADGTFTYTQVGQLDHADGTNPNDVINLSFGIKATDADGDVANGTITVQVKDDAPVAVNDVATLASAPGSVSGNVTANDTVGEDRPGYVVKTVTFGTTTVDVPATGTITIAGAHGNLTISHTGAYTYTGSSTGSDVFTYKIVDQDGDPATATLTVTVNDVDEQPCVDSVTVVLDETNVYPDGTESISGSVNPNYFGDGPGSVAGTGVFTSGGSQKGGALTSNGVAVVVTLAGDTYTGKANGVTVFTLKVNADGTFTYTQVGQLDHADGTNPNDVINLSFGIKATDADGDVANGTITVQVKDDAPVAVNDVATLASAPGSVSGNVTANDTVGEDRPGYVVKTVTFGTTTVDVPATGTITIAGAHGNLTISHTGAYTYTGSSTGSDVFTYKIVDQDGDPATATLTVTVNDVDEQPCVDSVTVVLDETNVYPDGTESISGSVNPNYFGDGPGSVAGTGVFTSGGSQKGGALTSNGVAVVVTLAGDTYTGKANGVTVFTLKVNADGTFTYTQVGQLDHADGTNPNDVINLSFGIKATDADGDVANGTITVQVKDDAPVAVNDVATLASAPGSVSGNVTANDTVGEDRPGYVVKTVTFGTTTVDVPATGTITIAGAHGNLTISHTGAYTYTGSSTGSDVFTYKIVDQDGDPATATLTVTVNDVDEQPCVDSVTVVLDETNVYPDGTESISGSVNPNYFGDGPGSVAGTGVFTSGGSQKGGALTSNGVAVVVTLAGDTYTGKANGVTVFTLKVNADGTFTYTQVGQLDHADGTNPNDVINLSFGIKATDADGDVANGTITVQVKDDAPVAVNDVATLASAPGSVSGNVTANDTVGEDRPGYVVKTVTFGTTTVDVPATGTITIAGAHGNLTISHTGAYTYTGSSTGSDVFTYKIVDQDGDPATATLTVTVNDVDEQPCVDSVTVVLDETNVYPDGTESISGSVNPNYFGDGPGSVAGTGVFTSGGSQKGGALTSNGVAVVVTLAGDTYTGKANGVTVFTLKVNADGTFTYTQVGQLDHADGTNPNDVINLSFGIKATDADGDVANGTITVQVKDDAPVAVNDVATLASAPGSVSGNVTANDTVGEDRPGYVVKTVTFGTTTVDVPATGTITIAGAHGNLTISHTGAYTYTGSSTGSDVFTYKIVDQDGDPATATLTVTVNDVDEQPCVDSVTVVLDETNVYPDGTESISGSVNPNYFGDGPGSVAGTGVFTSGGSQKGGALTSNGVAVVVTLAGDTYTGKANGVTVFTLKVNADGTFTYTQVGQLDHADGTNPNDVINLSFGIKATDADGDVANGTITVQVKDDAPVAVNDVATLASAPGSVSGNVTANDTVGEDRPGYVVKTVTFGTTTVDVPATGTITIAGAHGNLTISHTGAYTYTGSSTGSDVFTYKIVDQDGDPATATLTVTVNDVDEQPCVDSVTVVLDETNVYPDGTESISGSVNPNYFGDGPGSVAGTGVFTSGGSQKGGALTSNGVAVVVTLAGDTYTGKANGVTVFTLKVNADGTFTYTQVGQLDHADGTNPNDVINLSFGIKATDADGDVANGTITVQVKDDAPVAVNDVATLASAPGSVSGNVTANDTVGEDRPGYVVKTVTFGTTTVDVPATGTITIAGAHGNLTISHTGAYTYTGSSTGSDVFTYKIVDQDGDPATATLTVTVNDVDTMPTVQNAALIVDETNVANSGAQIVNGTLTIDYKSDGPGTASSTGTFSSGGSLKAGALTSNGVPVVVALVGDMYEGKAGGVTIFTLRVKADGTYTFTQYGQLDHADTNNPDDAITLNFGFRATDSDGDSATGSIVVTVKDDGPTAVNDSNTVVDANVIVGGNVLINDRIGEDRPGYVVKSVTFGTTTVDVPATGTVNIVSTNGTLTIGHDGVYTFKANGTTMGTDVFTYKILDQDGDPSTATLSVAVNDIDSHPCGCGITLTVDETTVAANGSEVLTGVLVQNYYGEGPGAITCTGLFTSGGSQKGGALTSHGVPVVVALVGDTYTGKAGSEVIFTLKLGTDGAYTFTQFGQLDHADGTNPDDVINLSFGFRATDADGDSSEGTIVVRVLDDAPIAADDAAVVDANTHLAIGNVTLNDKVGEDHPGYVVKSVTFGTTTVDVPATGTVSVTGAHGNLVIDHTGAYTYTGTTQGVDMFTYKILDQDGDAATAKLVVTVPSIIVPPEPPCITGCDVIVCEDDCVQLKVSAAAVNGNGNEVLTITISGIKAGWGVDTSQSGGTYNAATGVWTKVLAAGQSFDGGPLVSPPHNSDADMTGLVVKASVYDPDSNQSAQATAVANVYTDAVADNANLSVALNVVSINGHTTVDLGLQTTLNDTDGSEVIKEVRIEGLPGGLTLSAGTYDAVHGYWVLTAAQANGNIHVNTPDNFSGSFSLHVTAVTQELNLSGYEDNYANNTAYTTSNVNVSVNTMTAMPMSVMADTFNATTVVEDTADAKIVIDNGGALYHAYDPLAPVATATIDPVTHEPIVICGFDPKAGDILDISSLVETPDVVTSAINDFVFVRVEDGNTIVSADVTGSGQTTDIAVLQGVSTAVTVQVDDLTQTIQQQQNQSGIATA